MHISSTLTISPSLTVFEEILRRACEARLMENFTGFTCSLKEMLSLVRHMREDGRAECVDTEREKACGKSIFTAVFWASVCRHCFKSVDTVDCQGKSVYLALGCVIFLIPRDLLCNMQPQQGAHLWASQ